MLSREETIKIYDNIYRGLAERGFGPLDGSECSRGGCHTSDGKHYILLTDGMLIYSNISDYYQKDDYLDSVVKEWFHDEFLFEELDNLINSGEK